MKNIKVGSLIFGSKTKACEYFGVSVSQVSYWVKKTQLLFQDGIEHFLLTVPKPTLIKRLRTKRYITKELVIYDISSLVGKDGYLNKSILTHSIRDNAVRYFGGVENLYKAAGITKFVNNVSLSSAMSKPVKINNLNFISKTAALKHFDISESAMLRFENLGYSTDNAINKILQNKKQRNNQGESITVRGIQFKSIRSCCDYYKLSSGYVCIFSKNNNVDIGSAILTLYEASIKLKYLCKTCYSFYSKFTGLDNNFCSKICKEVAPEELIKELYLTAKDQSFKGRTTKLALFEKGITAKKVAFRDSFICQLCGYFVKPYRQSDYSPLGWSVGHIIPLSRGGDHTWDNVQCECVNCNSKKHTMTNDEYLLKLRNENDKAIRFC